MERIDNITWLIDANEKYGSLTGRLSFLNLQLLCMKKARKLLNANRALRTNVIREDY